MNHYLLIFASVTVPHLPIRQRICYPALNHAVPEWSRSHLGGPEVGGRLVSASAAGPQMKASSVPCCVILLVVFRFFALGWKFGRDRSQVFGKFVRIIAQRGQIAKERIESTDSQRRARSAGIRRAITLPSRSKSMVTPSR